jgi:hypothetical protein
MSDPNAKELWFSVLHPGYVEYYSAVLDSEGRIKIDPDRDILTRFMETAFWPAPSDAFIGELWDEHIEDFETNKAWKRAQIKAAREYADTFFKSPLLLEANKTYKERVIDFVTPLLEKGTPDIIRAIEDSLINAANEEGENNSIYCALCEISAKKILCGETLPPRLAQFVAGVLTSQDKPLHKHGKNAKDKQLRNLFIVLGAWLLKYNFHVKIARAVAGPNNSAYDILTKAATKNNSSDDWPDMQAFSKIWYLHQPIIETVADYARHVFFGRPSDYPTPKFYPPQRKTTY